MGRWLPRRGWLGHDGLSRHLNDLTRPAVPSDAVQERMLAEDEERRGLGSALLLPDDAGRCDRRNWAPSHTNAKNEPLWW